ESVLGAGSTFSFELPMDGNAAHAQSVRDVDSDKDRRGAMMLAIPAGPVRTTLSLFAAEFGLDVRATDAAAPSSPRVIVTDLDGLARVREVRVDAATCPVILLTRMGESAGEALLKRGAVQGILEVPFSSAEAREAIDAALAGRVSALHLSGHEASPVVDHQHFKGVRVLAADDSPINREVLIEALRRLGADVTCVDDGAAAFEAVKRGGFDLVFMDGSMPVLDGFDATRAIRAWEAEAGKAALPVVGLSAHVFGDRAEVWRACGMTDFITKPFTLAAIRMCLERTVGDVRRDAGGSSADGIAAAEDASGDNAVAPLIDPTVLQSIRDMQAPGDDLVARVTTLYVEHAPKLLEKVLVLAAAPADMAEIASAAHALKSLSRNVGAVRVGDLSGAIEDAARGGTCAIAAHSDAMRQAVTDTIAELQSAAVPAPATQRVA
ncbi:MAG: response regulator, partial [Hyphomicrobium sp.]